MILFPLVPALPDFKRSSKNNISRYPF